MSDSPNPGLYVSPPPPALVCLGTVYSYTFTFSKADNADDGGKFNVQSDPGAGLGQAGSNYVMPNVGVPNGPSPIVVVGTFNPSDISGFDPTQPVYPASGFAASGHVPHLVSVAFVIDGACGTFPIVAPPSGAAGGFSDGTVTEGF